LNMKLSWLVIWAGTLFLNPATADCNIASQNVTCEESGKNLTDIPSNLFQNVTELHLNRNMITVVHSNSFCNMTRLVILDISNNEISSVHKAAFAGLNQLSVLNISHNKITQLDSEVFTSLNSLTVLDLQYNQLKSLHINPPLKLTTIVLAGNLWTCSCDLVDLQKWLTTSNVTMENENDTTCTFPNSKQKLSIKTAPIQPTDCKIGKASLENIETSTSAVEFESSALPIAPTTNNSTGNNGTDAALPLIGKSWTFLAGVLGFVLSTTLLIFTAIKCPVWYQYVVSYRHRRLQENDSEMFEQEFSADMSSSPASTNDDDPIVIFEKFHEFVQGEDEYIEDKYIDSYETEER
ncbi:LRC19 protein, partial [Indicator maculatus]|nr:LRC19 protein [Indicator maculatus]